MKIKYESPEANTIFCIDEIATTTNVLSDGTGDNTESDLGIDDVIDGD